MWVSASEMARIKVSRAAKWITLFWNNGNTCMQIRGEATGAAQCRRAPNWDWGKQEQAIKGKSGICATTLNRCRHTRTHPHIHLSPFPPPPFLYAQTPLGATELNPQESPLETFALLCPQASCTASLSLSPSLSTSLSRPLPPLHVFCIPTFLLLRPHTSHTNCASSSSCFFYVSGSVNLGQHQNQ